MKTIRISAYRTRFAVLICIGFNIVALAGLFVQSAGQISAGGISSLGSAFSRLIARGEQLRWSVDMVANEGCGLCAMNHELCEEIGEANLARAISYAGSNDRLRRALARMRAGEPLTFGVLGGSVSIGHGVGAGYDPNDPRNLNRIIFDHIDALFPQKAGTVLGDSGRDRGMNGYVNGAQGATGSDYFSLCFNEHIPEDVDLVILELAINDEAQVWSQDSYERLVRALLDLPRKPAILNLQVFALMFSQMVNGGDLHNGIAQYYDLPVLSLRNALLPSALSNVSVIRDLFHRTSQEKAVDLSDVDLRHISTKGHRLVGQLANTYIDSQLCEMARLEAKAGTNDIDKLYPSPPLPRLRLVSQYDQQTHIPKIAPNCFSMNGKKQKLAPLRSDGWREWNWDAKHYLVADQPGSTITFGFSTSLGWVQLNYLRSAIFGLGSVFCWVDGERQKGIVVDGYWAEAPNLGRGATIRDDLEPGDHELHCELLEMTADPNGGREFRIISVMSF